MPPGKDLKILFVDRHQDDFLLTRDLLDQSGTDPWTVEWAPDHRMALPLLLEGDHDVALIGCDGDDTKGIDLVRSARAGGCTIPLIVLTRYLDVRLDNRAMVVGADDYLVKDEFTGPGLDRALRYAVERRRTLNLLTRRERQREYLAAIVESSGDGILGITLDGTVVSWNTGAERLFGYSVADVVGRSMSRLVAPDNPDELLRLLARVGRGEILRDRETVGITKDGRHIAVLITISPIRDTAGSIIGASLMARDNTGRKGAEAAFCRLQEQFWQAQKMDTVGRLAAGIAHDLNNLLSVILGFSECTLERIASAEPLEAEIKQIRAAGERGVALTGRLLAFCRKQSVAPQPLDLNELVAGMEAMLRRLIGEDIRLVTRYGEEHAWIAADPVQIEQVIMNLVVNAKDAMPSGGTLEVVIAKAAAGRTCAAYPDAITGPHIHLSVRDTGTGMADELRAHLFEPFFTTKEPGKGTGLGLSTVHGIVTRSGGRVFVDSAPGRGTRFTICFPALESSARGPAGLADTSAAAKAGAETIVRMEDERQAVVRDAASVEQSWSGTGA